MTVEIVIEQTEDASAEYLPDKNKIALCLPEENRDKMDCIWLYHFYYQCWVQLSLEEITISCLLHESIHETLFKSFGFLTSRSYDNLNCSDLEEY